MRTEVEQNLFEAWWELEPKLKADPEELARRLARRDSKQFRRPLRAFCFVVRANDTRINPMDAIIVPRHAVHLDAIAHPGRYAEHQVTIDDRLVKNVCQPCEIGSPGERASRVAQRLGCRPADLMYIRRNGLLRTTLKPGLGGQRGKPVPLVYTLDDLDPSARGKRAPDEALGHHWRSAADGIPAGFRQVITRIPRYRRIKGREQFQAWEWICPSCRRAVSRLYYPLPHPDLAVWYSIAPIPKPWGQVHAPIFACCECHDPVTFGRGQLHIAWNQLILHYSGGLLYGHEVKKPAWLQADPSRLKGFRPESARSLTVKRLLVTTDSSYTQIARQLRLSKISVAQFARRIFQRENVRTRADLRARLAASYPQPRPIKAAG